MINVLIVDDSAVVRQTLSQIFEEEDDIRVIATAQDPIIAAQKLKTQVPDVITLDIEMPRMDGLTFLSKLMAQYPIPVVICSSVSEKGSETALRALELGAVDIITKPNLGAKSHLLESSVVICDAIRAASKSRIAKRALFEKSKQNEKAIVNKTPCAGKALPKTTEKIVVIGASTGGTEAIRSVLEALPVDSPGILIVQHMPENFTRSFAERLNQNCAIQVREATNNESVLRGTALIAPGNKHMELKRSGARYYVALRDGPLVSRHRPSVDVLFKSAAYVGGKNIVAAILTGMGSDGASGMTELLHSGATTIAQDEESCVVYGMPREAVKREAVQQVANLQEIAGLISRN